ncbi:MATE family efflux transporter [Photobacterium jeanii]|uniref:Multidrug export protein MepA n=1 Tax=Photobacterium jeanii TaxID=858640 RepID=A0A178K434_9GAMM|nr:MATE family efflux transporter [Photobacterium jeanii]OAN11715.1 MATE family efflux transporter [Photobacterium jeanii]PST91251.1 multidrug efflux protein [Photobacterium jeanii]
MNKAIPSESISRQFWRYTLPTVAAMLVNGLYQVVDGIFIGRYVGAQGLAAINVAWPIIGTILGIGLMIGVGTGALCSVSKGEGKDEKARRILSTGLIYLVLASFVASGFLFAFGKDLLMLQGATGEVLELGHQYISILAVAVICAFGSISVPFLLRNDGRPNFATGLMVLGALANIGLDYVLIAWLKWELTGAAIATAVSQGIVTVIGLGYFFTDKANLRLSLNQLSFSFTHASGISWIGLSSFFMYAYSSFMVALHNLQFIKYGDVTMVGAYAILGYIVTVYYLVAEGVAGGMQPLVSYNYGARNQSNIQKALKLGMLSAVIIGILFVLLVNFKPYEFASIFNRDDNTLIEQTVMGLRLHLFALFLDGFLVIAGAYYQAIGKGGKSLFVTIGNMAVQLPFLFLLPLFMGANGVWLALPLSNIALTSVVAVMMYRDIKQVTAAASESKMQTCQSS